MAIANAMIETTINRRSMLKVSALRLGSPAATDEASERCTSWLFTTPRPRPTQNRMPMSMWPAMPKATTLASPPPAAIAKAKLYLRAAAFRASRAPVSACSLTGRTC